MTDSQHTPGRWHVATLAKDDPRLEIMAVFEDGTGEGLAIVQGDPNDPEVVATAFVLAAAPDMLAALVLARGMLGEILGAAENGEAYTPEELLDYGTEFLSDLDVVTAAIAKAKGE